MNRALGQPQQRALGQPHQRQGVTPPSDSYGEGEAERSAQDMVTESLQFLSTVTRYNQWMSNTLAPFLGERILELGCGTGNMLQYFLLKEHLIGIDLDPALIAWCKDLFRSHTNCEFHAGDIFEDEFEFQVQPDSVVSTNVLEHIEDDRRALEWIANQLPAGGKVVILVPAHPSIFGEIDRAAGHFRRYTKRELKGKVEAAGFQVTHAQYFNLIGYFGWGLNSRLLKKRDIPTGQTTIYDRLIAPLQAWLEPLLPTPFGQSLIVAGHKL